ncbi:hypothetical protein ABK040_012467 [Willaertia magna]
MKILLSLILGLIVATYVSAACNSAWVSSDVTTGLFSPNCPVGFYSGQANGTYSCKQVTADMIGQSCTFNADCKLSWLYCVTGKCVVRQTRFQYESCTDSFNCGYENYEPLNCVNSECKTYNKFHKYLGESCGEYDSAKNQKTVCGSGKCVASLCRKVVQVEVGKTCGIIDNTVYNECVSGARCDSTYTCVKAFTQGQDCTYGYECAEGLTCRYASTSANKTTDDCSILGYGTGPILVKCNTAANKCQRLYSAKVGDSCSNNEECYSGYCNSGKCAQLPQKTACSVGNGCNNNPAACICGGKVTTVEDGICAASCQGRAYDVYACAWNAGVTSDTSSFIQNFFDNKSKIFNSCKNELQNYYKCMKGSMGTAGVTGALDTLPNLEFKGDAPTDENPIMPKYNSASSIVASFALILMIFAAMFAL